MTILPSKSCRFCGAELRYTFCDLGMSPLANRNLQPIDISKEKLFPLIARVCEECFLVQVDDSVPPEDLFSDYDYFSSFSTEWVAHAKRYSEEMRDRFSLTSKSLVVEIASNDGYLLRHFVEAGVPVLGVEPAANVAIAAEACGVPTEVAFFGVETAQRIASRGQNADLMVANNVLAHAPNTRDFVAGFAELLATSGVATFEFPHLLRLIDQVQFDTIYHEHFFYLSLVAVEKIMKSAGLRVFDVVELPTHGGSLRLFVCHISASYVETQAVRDLRDREHFQRLDRLEGYTNFEKRVEEVKASFLAFTERVQREGKTIAAYGAAAKGNTFLNYCGIHYPAISAVYDLNPAKQNKVTPGTHIPILSPEAINELKPDYLLILPWNIAEEIMKSMDNIKVWGGRFVTAVPSVRIY